jgi:hypothetical protein
MLPATQVENIKVAFDAVKEASEEEKASKLKKLVLLFVVPSPLNAFICVQLMDAMFRQSEMGRLAFQLLESSSLGSEINAAQVLVEAADAVIRVPSMQVDTPEKTTKKSTRTKKTEKKRKKSEKRDRSPEADEDAEELKEEVLEEDDESDSDFVAPRSKATASTSAKKKKKVEEVRMEDMEFVRDIIVSRAKVQCDNHSLDFDGTLRAAVEIDTDEIPSSVVTFLLNEKKIAAQVFAVKCVTIASLAHYYKLIGGPDGLKENWEPKYAKKLGLKEWKNVCNYKKYGELILQCPALRFLTKTMFTSHKRVLEIALKQSAKYKTMFNQAAGDGGDFEEHVRFFKFFYDDWCSSDFQSLRCDSFLRIFYRILSKLEESFGETGFRKEHLADAISSAEQNAMQRAHALFVHLCKTATKEELCAQTVQDAVADMGRG